MAVENVSWSISTTVCDRDGGRTYDTWICDRTHCRLRYGARFNRCMYFLKRVNSFLATGTGDFHRLLIPFLTNCQDPGQDGQSVGPDRDQRDFF